MNRVKLNFDLNVFCGDIHGEWLNLYRKAKSYQLTNCNLIICGDIGIGFEEPRKLYRTLKYYNNLFRQKSIFVYAIRGNHDDPSYFTNNTKYSNIHLVQDYTVLETPDNIEKILCIGGATSIDRCQRKLLKTYWSDEIIVRNEEILKTLTDITIVATHSSPTFVEPFIKNNLSYWAEQDKNILTDVNIERGTLDNIYYDLMDNKNPITKWYYGHYHYSSKQQVFDIRFKMLDILELCDK